MQRLIQRLTQRLRVRSEGRRLILSRRTTRYLLALVPVVATCLIVLSFCFLRAPGSNVTRAKVLSQTHVFAFSLFFSLCVPWLALGISRLRPQVWDFDLETRQVLYNGLLVCPVEEVESIHVDRSYYNSDYQVLYLRTKARTNIQVADDGMFGVLAREMREQGSLIASHLGVALVLKDEYVPGRSDKGRSACGSRRWGRKGQRRDLTRGPRRGAV